MTSGTAGSPRDRRRIGDGWLFHRGELDPPPGRGAMEANTCHGGSDLTPDERPDSADSESDTAGAVIPGLDRLLELDRERPLDLADWRAVNLPHDWRIEERASPDGPLAQAFAPRGVAYYRRTFPAGEFRDNRRTFVEFDGVMRDASVWCNGFFVGDHLSGYAGFRFDLTELLRYDGEGESRNVLLVRCDTTTPEGWWYEGGGIYRDVWLTTLPAVHVDFDGLAVTISRITPSEAVATVVTTVRNHGDEPVDAQVTMTVADPAENVVATAASGLPVGPDDAADLTHELTIPCPALWGVGEGCLYSLTVEVSVDGELVDVDRTTFGIRSVEFRGSEGMFLNGERVQLQGANIHQDFAGVGVALPDRIVEHKLRLLAEMGANAVRSAHHPPSRALLGAADRLGLLVIAENRVFSTAPPYLADLEAMVRQGRNHPSVVLWSLENEESLEGTSQGTRILRALAAKVRRMDPSRPTTVGGLRGFDTNFYDPVDVVGAHYRVLNRDMERISQIRPMKPLIADEDGLFPTVRGQYSDDERRGLPSSFGTAMGLYGGMPKLFAESKRGGDAGEGRPYDLGEVWQWFGDHPEVAGAFVWTGLDYFGEPTPMRWPVNVSSYGAMDLCGFPKDYYWLLRSFFRADPLVHVLPHWTWPGREGERIRVWAYTNCDDVELIVNDTSLGRRAAPNHIARWDEGVIYEPGVIVARGFRDGAAVAEHATETAGPAERLACTVEPAAIAADGRDVALVSVSVVDAAGRLCPWAEDDVTFDVDGPAVVIGVGSGNPISLEPHTADRRRVFRGRGLAIVRAFDGRGGRVRVRATAEGLRQGWAEVSTTGAQR